MNLPLSADFKRALIAALALHGLAALAWLQGHKPLLHGPSQPQTAKNTASVKVLKPNWPIAPDSIDFIATKKEAPSSLEPPAKPAKLASTPPNANASPAPRTEAESAAALTAGAANGSTASWPVQYPESTQLRYSVSRDGQAPFAQTAQLHWQSDGQRYQLRWQSPGWQGAPRRAESAGRLGEQGPAPQRYAEVMGGSRGKERFAEIDADAGRIDYGGGPAAGRSVAEAASGLQDRLSVALLVSAWLLANPSVLKAGQRVDVPITGVGAASNLALQVVERSSSAGPGAAWVHVRAAPRHAYDNTVEWWFAESLRWLPSAMRYTRPNGSRLDFVLSGTPATVPER